MTTSVLLPSYRRPDRLTSCLQALANQTQLPDEVLVVWQGNDTGTRDIAEKLAPQLPFPLRILKCADPGIVPAENVALKQAQGYIILMIDDDAVAPPDWVSRHIGFYQDATVGAVGGVIRNCHLDGAPFDERAASPNGTITWFGKVLGNLYDQPGNWRVRPPEVVDHLAGGNMSLRRSAFHCFEDRLLPYWQLFEAEVCLQAKARGYRVMLDFGNVVRHYPTNKVYDGRRDGDLHRKIFNGAFNHAFILAKHSRRWLRPPRLGYLLFSGTLSNPGLAAFLVAVMRYGHPVREGRVLLTTIRHHLAGWRAGTRARTTPASAGHRYAAHAGH